MKTTAIVKYPKFSTHGVLTTPATYSQPHPPALLYKKLILTESKRAAKSDDVCLVIHPDDPFHKLTPPLPVLPCILVAVDPLLDVMCKHAVREYGKHVNQQLGVQVKERLKMLECPKA